MKELRGYFERQHASVSLLNQLMGLWASGSVRDLLTAEQRKATVDAAFSSQQSDVAAFTLVSRNVSTRR